MMFFIYITEALELDILNLFLVSWITMGDVSMLEVIFPGIAPVWVVVILQ